MTMNETITPLEQVLYEFSVAKPVPDAELLEEFVRQYPAYVSALTDLAVDLALDASIGDEETNVEAVSPEVSASVSRAMSRFQNRLFEVKGNTQQTAAAPIQRTAHAENPFTKLSREQFRDVTKRLNCNTVFAGLLRDRQINADTMTPGFKSWVAQEMQVPPAFMAAHFAGHSEMPRGQLYKADEKPAAVQKISFEEAVRTSGLTPEQQEFLLSL